MDPPSFLGESLWPHPRWLRAALWVTGPPTGLACSPYWLNRRVSGWHFLTVFPLLDWKKDSEKGKDSACSFMKFCHSIINNYLEEGIASQKETEVTLPKNSSRQTFKPAPKEQRLTSEHHLFFFPPSLGGSKLGLCFSFLMSQEHQQPHPLPF